MVIRPALVRTSTWSAVVTAVALLATLVTLSPTADALGGPTNDQFTSPTAIAGSSGSQGGTTVGATNDDDEPLAYADTVGVWYQWVAPSTGLYEFTVGQPGSVGLQVEVFAGTTLTSMRPLYAADPFPMISGQPYRMRVSSPVGSESPFTLTWSAGGTINNDSFSDADPRAGGNTSVDGSNIGATAQVCCEPSHAGNGPNKSVWYRWTAPATGTVTFDTFGSTFDTLLGAYTVAGGLGGAVEVASNDDAGGTTQSELSFAATRDTEYYIAVDGFNGAEGVFILSYAYGAPTNDHYANATGITQDSGSLSTTTAGSTGEAGEPAQVPQQRYGRDFASTWFQYTPASPRRLHLEADRAGVTGNPTLGVYVGPGVSNLFEAGTDDNGGGGSDAELGVYTIPTVDYRIAIGAHAQTDTDIDLNWNATACPANPPDTPVWVDGAVRWATCMDFMTGYPDGTFRPNLSITRAQVARLLYRVAGSPDVSGLPHHGLSDVPAWVDDAVSWLVANQYATGYADDTFRPNLPITRAQEARMLYRVAGSPSGSPAHGFTDVPGWVASAVDWLTDPANNPPYATGYPDNTFRPNRDITRAQTTRMTCRIDTPSGTC